MPVGDCENAFLDAASRDGVELVRYKKPWLNQQGHFGLPSKASTIVPALHDIFLDLNGDPVTQSSKRAIPLPGDFIHVESGTIIEVDEMQHFTSYRLSTFSHYPEGIPLGFDISEYADLCHRFAPTADKYRRTKSAAAFGLGGRQRQRAYYDALRDLAIPTMGNPPIVRISALDNNGSAAYVRNRDRILHLTSGSAAQLP